MKRFIFLMSLAVSAPVMAGSNPLSVNFGGTTFVLPFQKVSATQLYSSRDKKGYPGAETVLAAWGKKDDAGNQKTQLTFGAAPVLGTSQNVPFIGVQTRLSPKYFDTTNNSILFGVWVGKESNQKRSTYGVKASVPLW